MKKSLLLINFLLLAAFGSVIYAKAPTARTKYGKSSKNNLEQIKFGPQAGSGLTSHKIGLFGEYKFDETLGLQVDLLYFRYAYFMSSVEVSEGGSAFAQTDHISLPIMLRVYQGNDKQFCWFGGVQLGYLITGEFKFRAEEELDFQKNFIKILDDFANSPNISLKDISGQDKINKFQLGIIAGFDYEFSFGLTLGLSYTKDFIDILKSKESYGNWTLQPTLGYNFGKLFK